ncbi:MAG: hypothetical protein V5A28_08155 [Haloarculaceae archaeon]
MERKVPVRAPAPAVGAVLGLFLVAVAGVLGWADPGWSEPGFRHAPYLAVAPLAILALVVVASRPTERTCLAAATAGLAVALTAKGSVWSAGRVAAFLGGTAILLGGAAGYYYDPRFDLRRVPLVTPSPPTDGWLAAVGALAVGGLAAVTVLPSADGLVDRFAGLVLVATVLVCGVGVVLYRWGPDLRVGVLGFPLVVPSLVVATPIARLVDPLVGFLVAALAVGLTCTLGLGLVFANSISVARGLVGPPVALRHERGRSLSHLATLPVLAVGAGLAGVLLGGRLPWHARVFRFGAPSPLPEAGVGVPGYYLVLGLATAAFLVAVVRWTDSAMGVVAGLGVLVTITATGENPLDGGRLAATVGGGLIVVGALLANSDGRDVGLRALALRRPRAPLAGWLALSGWLLVVGPLALSRPLLGPATSLVVDPFVRQGATGVFLIAVSAADVTAVGAVAVLVGGALAGSVVCLFRWHPDTGVALGLTGLVLAAWTVAILFVSGGLTPEGCLVAGLVGVGALALLTAGGLSLADGSGEDDEGGERDSPAGPPAG